MTKTTSADTTGQTPPALVSRRLFIGWTVGSALVVWLGLTIAEGVAAERCYSDGLAWNWKTWSCEFRAGSGISLPQGLRRSH